MKTIELDAANRRIKRADYGKIPDKPNENITHLAAPHIDSFNYFLDEGLQEMMRLMPKCEFCLANGDKICLTFEDLEVNNPKLSTNLSEMVDINLYPKECIERGITYKGVLTGTIACMVNHRMESPLTVDLGEIPIMVKSNKCNLHGMSPEEMVRHGELVNETGGFFIINGGCRILRLLIANRRNYPLALVRKSWKTRDNNFSDKGIMIRCLAEDESSTTNILHHLDTGGVKLEITVRKEIFLIPLIMALKVMVDYSDRLIYLYLISGREKDKYYSEKVKMMMRELQERELYTQQACKEYIGKTFRQKLSFSVPIWKTNEEACEILFEENVLIHLHTMKQKFETMCMMTRKLFAFIGGEALEESCDVVSTQEASLGGHTYIQFVKRKLLDTLTHIKTYIIFKSKDEGDNYTINDCDLKSAAKKVGKIGDMLCSFVSTGSVPTSVNTGLMQNSGLSIMFDHLNRMRDMSHLRAIHRGSYFLEMKTIAPRRLTGEAWGFICPVHTPDGAPCGLLNHLAFRCVIPCLRPDSLVLTQALVDLGMTPVEAIPLKPHSECVEVIADGCLSGYVPKDIAREFADNLRSLKVTHKIYQYTEIVLIMKGEHRSQYPGLFLFTNVSRLMRPVLNLTFRVEEYIGTFEQVYLNIAVSPETIEEGVHTHMEVEKTSMLSNIGRLVPFSDCNPNPRNMYQCQMGKQTMGTPLHNWRSNTFSKLYRLQYPQIPLVRNSHYDTIEMDEFCMGFNAVLAIVSYTGYDMEDAMVINKCAMERGLGQGQVYKSEFVDLLGKFKNKMRGAAEVTHIFSRDPGNPELKNFLDENGLPFPGTPLKEGDPYYSVFDLNQRSYRVVTYKGEDCVVDKYSIINSDNKKTMMIQKVNITIRVRRDPIIGDKFASRSGQKGVMSRLYPMEDLPFSERGIVPDIIFNPHGIPSRMTAGTLIELMAGKCGAEFGKGFDSTPFEFSDENPAYDYFGQILEKAGFNYYGEDVLYSGTDGRMMEVKVFEGVVYYQRLRHMTADKWQVRSTGPMDTTTHQPIKGRKRGGAIRFGEMERDCLIAHGASYTLKDRLLDCSDDSKEWVCSKCGSLLSPITVSTYSKQYMSSPKCRVCGPDVEMRQVHLPHAFKCLVSELSSVGIKTDLGLKPAEKFFETDLKPTIKIEKES